MSAEDLDTAPVDVALALDVRTGRPAPICVAHRSALGNSWLKRYRSSSF